jgi:CheY-like chemotaxis protein
MSSENIEINPKRVLLVEDYPALAEMTTWALEMDGHEVVVAKDGPSAIELAKSYLPDVILMDIGIPGMDGYTVCKLMRQEPILTNTVIIAQTGWGEEKHRRMSKEAGFDHHFVKPVDLDLLRNTIQTASHKAVQPAA